MSAGDPLGRPRRGAAPGVGEVPPAQLVDDLRARVVLEAPQVLQAEGADRLDLVVVEVGPEHDVGEDLQGRDRGSGPSVAAGDARVQRLGALAVADAQVVERREQLAAVALARAPA